MIGWIFLFLIFIFIVYLLLVIIVPRITLIGKSTKHKVYVSLGFHANLYHSYRIDTNDEAGFGKDIRIIRRIIEVLDEYNGKGIPVKGVWDIENLFSLQEQLPRYAPDIIENLQRRVRERGDEIILMSYNNALASALNEEEFKISIQRAISNKQRSGVQDIFQKWSPIVRPQEMMVTPGNYRLYRDLGIEALVLYYSAITFDAFRVFVPELSLEEAHNPLLYKNAETGEEIIIIPAYNHGDLAENVSLRRWVRQLHREQLRGNINRDVLICINADADDSYWYGYTFPAYLAWLPNTGGLRMLIDEVSDLDYVEFTTLAEYLKDHPPLGEVSFGQDLADGSFNGYVSWSEKAYCHDYWTEVQRNRRLHDIVGNIYQLTGTMPGGVRQALNNSFEKRLRLQSTTNFGMATPFLARTRERVVESLIRDMRASADAAREKAFDSARGHLGRFLPPVHDRLKYIDSFLLIRPGEGRGRDSGVFLTFTVAGDYADADFYLSGKDGGIIRAFTIWTEERGENMSIKLFVPSVMPLQEGVYFLYAGEKGSGREGERFRTVASRESLKNEFIEIGFDDDRNIRAVSFQGVQQLKEGSFIPRIHYGDEWYTPEALSVSIEKDGRNGVASVRLTGNFTLPVEGTVPGRIDYLFTLIHEVPALFIEGEIGYPETPRRDVFKAYQPSLARRYDEKWQEVAPVELVFAHRADKEEPFRVLKRNYLGVESSYAIDYFRHSSENLDLANVNNHITAEYVALEGMGDGLAVAMDTSVQANFAGMPLKISYHSWGSEFSAKINPFGTYFGGQYYQPTWGNRQGYEVALKTGDQYATSASTYNGYTNEFSLMITFFSGKRVPAQVRENLIAFAHPPAVIMRRGVEIPPQPIQVAAPEGFLPTYSHEDGGVYFHWEKVADPLREYRIYCGTESGSYDRVYRQKGSESTLFLKEYAEGSSFEIGKRYYAVVTAVFQDGRESEKSEEMSFIPSDVISKEGGPKLSIFLQLKVLWLTIKSYVD